MCFFGSPAPGQPGLPVRVTLFLFVTDLRATGSWSLPSSGAFELSRSFSWTCSLLTRGYFLKALRRGWLLYTRSPVVVCLRGFEDSGRSATDCLSAEVVGVRWSSSSSYSFVWMYSSRSSRGRRATRLCVGDFSCLRLDPLVCLADGRLPASRAGDVCLAAFVITSLSPSSATRRSLFKNTFRI